VTLAKSVRGYLQESDGTHTGLQLGEVRHQSFGIQAHEYFKHNRVPYAAQIFI